MNPDAEHKLKLSSATISVILHATEDKERLTSKIVEVLGLNSTKFDEIKSEGHWGNEIRLLNLCLKQTEAEQLIRKILLLLEELDQNKLPPYLEESVDEKNSLYVRIDKQKLFSGRIAFSDHDPIRIKFRLFKTFKQGDNTTNYRELLSSKQ